MSILEVSLFHQITFLIRLESCILQRYIVYILTSIQPIKQSFYINLASVINDYFGGESSRESSDNHNSEEELYMVLCATQYYLNNLKNVKNTQGGVLLLVKLQVIACNLIKVTLFYGCFSRFLNSTNGTKSHNTPYIFVAWKLTKINKMTIIRYVSKITTFVFFLAQVNPFMSALYSEQIKLWPSLL